MVPGSWQGEIAGPLFAKEMRGGWGGCLANDEKAAQSATTETRPPTSSAAGDGIMSRYRAYGMEHRE